MRLLFVTLMVFGLAGTVNAAEKQPTACMDLYLKRCDKCHYMDRVCKQVGKRSARGWKKTIHRMVKVRGAEVTESEKAQLVECLSSPAPDVTTACKK